MKQFLSVFWRVAMVSGSMTAAYVVLILMLAAFGHLPVVAFGAIGALIALGLWAYYGRR
jgi:hypothetical protein